jgi:uncharacterized membrane protein
VVAISPSVSLNETNPEKIAFRWTYIVLPVLFLLLSVILAAFFYRLLPEEVAYHFSGSEPTGWFNRGGITAWALGLQFVFALLSLAIAGIATMASRHLEIGETGLNRSLFIVMGNLMALPQVIILFALLDIFLYNAYQVKLIPLWVFAVIVLAVGGVVLGAYFARSLRQSRRQPGKSPRE